MSPALAAGEALIRISSDPYTNPSSQHRTQVEPDTYSFGSTVVSAFQSGRFFNGGSSNIGFSTSTDSGRTWHHGFLPATTVFATPAGTYARASDPSVAYDARHRVWLISYLGLITLQKVDVVVSRSTDDGLSWSRPVAIDIRGTTAHQSLDKNWTACDDTPSSLKYGNCYTEYDNFSNLDLEQMSTSTDGGLTWSPAQAPAGNPSGIGGQPVVLPNGVVVVPYINLNFGVMEDFVSSDGGLSWSSSILISTIDFHAPNGGIRAGLPLPSAEIDASGRIYVAWSDCRFEAQCNSSDIVFSTSNDGVQWSPVHRIPTNRIGSGADYFIPGLAVDRSSPSKSAGLGLAYYFYPQTNCSEPTCQLDVGFISSTNGGVSWSSPETLAGPMSLTWLPNTTQGRMVGDYISTSIPPSTSTAAPVFALAHPPAAGLFDEAMYTLREDLATIRGGSFSTAADQPAVRPQAASTLRPFGTPTAR